MINIGISIGIGVDISSHSFITFEIVHLFGIQLEILSLFFAIDINMKVQR